jgi:hypothetical protein
MSIEHGIEDAIHGEIVKIQILSYRQCIVLPIQGGFMILVDTMHIQEQPHMVD